MVQSGVLKGLNQEDIKRAGQGLILQDGCKGFFQKIMKNENLTAAVNILSYCWCGDLIRSAFSSGNPWNTDKPCYYLIHVQIHMHMPNKFKNSILI